MSVLARKVAALILVTGIGCGRVEDGLLADAAADGDDAASSDADAWAEIGRADSQGEDTGADSLSNMDVDASDANLCLKGTDDEKICLNRSYPHGWECSTEHNVLPVPMDECLIGTTGPVYTYWCCDR